MSRPIAVVTGASAGVGRATVIELARRGFDVAVLARGDGGLEGAVEDAQRCGAATLALPVDVADQPAIAEACASVEREMGPIDVWVNNAMTTVFAPFDDVEPSDFRRAVEVTFLGQVWGTMAALGVMRPRDRGTIVNVGSALAFIGIPLQSAYCASKFACRGFAESVRAELLHEGSGVRLVMVHLPAMNTPQFDWCLTTLDRHPQPVPPIYQPDVAARAIVDSAIDGRPSRVVGSWNKLLVAAGSLAPNVGNHYASMGAWDSQLTEQPIDPARPANLREPVDATCDAGAEGSFSDRARGIADMGFVRSVPRSGALFVRSVGRALADAARWRTGRGRRLGPHNMG